MKKVLLVTKLFAFALCMVMMFGSCSLVKKAKLKSAIDDVNSELPEDLGDGMTLTSAALSDDGEFVEFNVKCNDDATLLALKQGKEATKELMKYSLVSAAKEDKDIQELFKYEVGIRYIYNDDNLQATIEVPYSEIKELEESDMSKSDMNERLLKITIKAADEACPTDMGDGMSMQSVKLSGDDVVYTFMLDENLYNINLLKQNLGQFKDAALKDAISDEDSRDEIKLIYDNKKNMVYQWVGDQTRTNYSLKISNAEIGKLLQEAK